MKNLKKLENRIDRLENSIRALDQARRCDRVSDISLERKIVRKIACSATGHIFRLKYAFINKKEGNVRYGKFECTICYLEIERPLTDKEETAAKNLGMLLF